MPNGRVLLECPIWFEWLKVISGVNYKLFDGYCCYYRITTLEYCSVTKELAPFFQNVIVNSEIGFHRNPHHHSITFCALKTIILVRKG